MGSEHSAFNELIDTIRSRNLTIEHDWIVRISDAKKSFINNKLWDLRIKERNLIKKVDDTGVLLSLIFEYRHKFSVKALELALDIAILYGTDINESFELSGHVQISYRVWWFQIEPLNRIVINNLDKYYPDFNVGSSQTSMIPRMEDVISILFWCITKGSFKHVYESFFDIVIDHIPSMTDETLNRVDFWGNSFLYLLYHHMIHKNIKVDYFSKLLIRVNDDSSGLIIPESIKIDVTHSVKSIEKNTGKTIVELVNGSQYCEMYHILYMFYVKITRQENFRGSLNKMLSTHKLHNNHPGISDIIYQYLCEY